MRHFLTILAVLCLLAAPAASQTVKALAYNTTNGLVAYSGTNVLAFTNNVQFLNGATILGQLFFADAGSIFFDGDTDVAMPSAYTSEQWRNAIQIAWASPAATNTRANLGFSTNLNTLWTATNAATARTNLSIGLPALTNTSNVTMMRALAGSTNTNAPYNGIFDFLDGDSNSVSVAISNGIIVSIE